MTKVRKIQDLGSFSSLSGIQRVKGTKGKILIQVKIKTTKKTNKNFYFLVISGTVLSAESQGHFSSWTFFLFLHC